MYSRQIFKISTLLFAFLIILLNNSCDVKQSTLGLQNRLFVVADSSFWDQIGEQVRQTFETEIVTPHTEKNFIVSWIPLSKLNALNDRMNIVFVGISGGDGAVDKYLEKYLPQQFKQGVQDGRYFYSFNDDMFARDQIGLIMVAKNTDTFLQNLNAQKEEIYKTFTKKYYDRLEKTMFERDEKTSLQDYLAEHFGWKVRLQQDYFVALQDLDNKFVWLRRIQPNRWISIWEIAADTALLNTDTLKHIRNTMARRYYQGDIVVDEDLLTEQVDLNGQQALKLTGLWQNDSLLVGGPFRLYAWHDQQNKKLRFIDIAVMAPGDLKKPFLDQLEVIAHTFELAEAVKN